METSDRLTVRESDVAILVVVCGLDLAAVGGDDDVEVQELWVDEVWFQENSPF